MNQATGRRQKAEGKDEVLVRRLAQLARIGLSAAEEKKYAQQFKDILRFVGEVENVRTGSLPPLTSTITGVQQVLREDAVVPSTLADTLLRAAPDAAQRMVKVPAIF